MTDTDDNTYVVDPESAVEMARLIDQDRTTTRAMGGPLSGVPDLPAHPQILDLACGPGGWVLDVAYACPDAEVAGVDISKTMIDYANARARTQGLINASFGMMNITQSLDFPAASFDLVNARFLLGVLKREAWESFFAECTRILKPGGILRLTEPLDFGITNSVSYQRLMALYFQTFQHAGYGFSVDGHTFGMMNTLPRMLRDRGYQQVRLLAYALEFSSDCEAWQDVYRNIEATSNVMAPFFVKTGLATGEECEQLHQQVLLEMLEPAFQAVMHLVTTVNMKS